MPISRSPARAGSDTSTRLWSRKNLPFLGLFRLYGGWLRWLALALTIGFVFLLPQHPLIACAPGGIILALLLFFRCPQCPTSQCNSLLSPADGIVDDLERMEDCPEISKPAMRIGIFLSVLDPHVTRSPLSGKVRDKRFIPGRFGNAMSRTVGSSNQRNEIWFETETGHSIFMRQISGAIARRVVFEPEPGDRVQAGAIVGMIRFGSRVELFIPLELEWEIMVSRGDHVHSGVTEICRPVSKFSA